MDKMQKALGKLTGKERKNIKEVLIKLKSSHSDDLDLKKLKGREDVFRVRKGAMRIIYRIDKGGNIFILTIERRNDKTYNF